ncbi:MAG: hypothetical protein ACLTDR_06935 [Adlercreutzia equolifaciens]
MPPRGYTSNMVGAYARLVGLNPTEVTRAYREEVYQFETGRRPASNRREAPPRCRTHGRAALQPRPGILSGLLPRRLRRLPALRPFRLGRFLGPHGQGGSAAPVHQPRPRAPGPGHRGEHRPRICRSIIVGAIIVGLLVLVIVLAFGNRAVPRAMCPRCPSPACRTPPAPIPVPRMRAAPTQRRPPSSPWRRRAPSSATTCPRGQASTSRSSRTARPWRRAMSPGPRRPISM